MWPLVFCAIRRYCGKLSLMHSLGAVPGMEAAPFFMRSKGDSVSSKRAGYDRDNRAAAKIILSSIQRYGGEQSGLVRWARLCLCRLDKTICTEKVPVPKQMTLGGLK